MVPRQQPFFFHFFPFFHVRSLRNAPHPAAVPREPPKSTFRFAIPMEAQPRAASMCASNPRKAEPSTIASPKRPASDASFRIDPECTWCGSINQVGYQEVSVHVNLVDSLTGYVTLDRKPDHPEAPSDSPDGVLQAGPQRPHGTGRAPNDPENPENPATLDACRNPRAVLRVC